jgi:hypothetical protein
MPASQADDAIIERLESYDQVDHLIGPDMKGAQLALCLSRAQWRPRESGARNESSVYPHPSCETEL